MNPNPKTWNNCGINFDPGLDRETMGGGEVIRHYVLGFLFSENKEHVLLMHKTHGPGDMAGKWNGLGGKIELKEGPATAMQREFREEADLDLKWEQYCYYLGSDWDMHCFRAFDDLIHVAESKEGEEIEVFPVCLLPIKLAHAVDLLVPLARADYLELAPLIRLVERESD